MYSKLRIRSDDESDYTAGAPNSTNVREPDVLSSYDTSSSYYSILGYGSTKDMADGIVEEYTATYNSIKKYKGFYIGRFELTGSVTSPTVQKGKEVLAEDWYNLKKACTNVVNSSYAQSTMIYGNQWDKVMDWLIDTGAKTSSEVNSNSSSWGNYLSIKTRAVEPTNGTKYTSGYSEVWKANNIYDLAGNCMEWTQEGTDTNARTLRGRFWWFKRL